jgi:hypothetical protein
MPAAADGVPKEYRTAGWIRFNLGVHAPVLLRLVAGGIVRAQTPAMMYPRYNIDDVQKWIKEGRGNDKGKVRLASAAHAAT